MMKNENLTDNGECDITGITPTQSVKQDLDATTKEKISGIYKIINKVNGKYYVGSSNNITLRWRKHKEALKRNQHKNRYLQRAWNKYGEVSFDFIIVETIPQDKLELIEQQYLDIGKTELHKIYNCSFIAGRIEMTEDVKQVLRDMAIIRYKNKINHPRYGKTHKAESINQIKTTLKGKMSGKSNPKFDNRTFTFSNVLTNETFIGNRFDFYTKYKINREQLCGLINGNAKSVHKWILK
jgi:group I intron endonuclease